MRPHIVGARLALTLALALAALGWLPAAAQEGEVQVRITQVDTSRFPRVTVHISVTDAAGNPVGIDPSRLTLEENGVPVEPEEILGMGEGDPITTLLVLDVSGSMEQRGKLAAAQDAARTYINQMRAGDKAGVLAFNTQVTEVQAITEDTQALLAAIDSLKAIEDTALYDALDRAVDTLEGQPGRKAVIVLSDGLDNSSTVTAADVLARVSDAELSVSTIGFGDPGAGAGSMAGIDEALLKDLAQQAGGMYGYAEDAAALTALFQSYGRALQSEYAITYVTPSAIRDGVNRGLTVDLSGPETVVAGERRYNPGGVVPEVAEPASWGAFGLALAALAVLLVAPALIRMIGQIPMRVREARSSLASSGGRDGGKAATSRAKGRVRLKKPGPPRVRIR